ncbi:Nuclear transport factor 2 [Plasmodiophora brassicae]
MAAPEMTKVAQAFVQHYYTMFDTNRTQLSSLYQPQSMLTFEGEAFMGAENIGNKLNSLPFRKVVHSIKTMDIQPSGCNGILIVVCGDLKIDDDANPLKYSQTFHILPTQQGSWWVHNDLFRLNIG